MADVTGVNSTLPTRLGGVSMSSGLPDFFADVDSTAHLFVVDKSDGPVSPGTAATTSTLIGGQFNTTLPTLANTQQSAIQLDSSGRVIIRPLTSADIVTANQGTANTLANAWPQKITDGTNGPVAVKPASTAATTSDPALVVTISPNSPSQSYSTGSGTVAALNGNVVGSAGSGVIWDITGTWVGTLTTQATNGDGSWINVASLSNQSGLVTNTTTINGTLEMNAAGWVQVRLIATAWTSGTADITWSSTPGSHLIIAYSSNGANFNTYTTLTDTSQNPLGTTAASTAATAAQEALVVAISPNSSPPTFSDKNSTGTITALNGTVVGTTGGCSSITFDVTGTWVATITVEATTGDGNWFIVNGDVDTTDSISSSFTVNTFITIPCGSFTQVRLRASAYTSGTVNVSWDASAGSNIIEVFNTNPASLITTTRLNDGSGNAITSTTVSAKQALDVNIAAGNPSTDRTGSGTISALNATVTTITTGCSSVSFTITGTWAGVLQIEGTVDNTNWVDLDGLILPAGSLQSTMSANGTITVPCGGFQSVRMIATSYSSGTATITWDSSTGVNIVQVVNPTYSNLNVAAYQPTAGDLHTTANLNDGSGNSIASINSQLETRDVLNVSSQYRAQSITTTAAEALGGATILVNRKLLHITPTNGTIYWGYSSSVTTTTGSPLFPNNTLWLSVTDNVHVYLIAAATTDSRIGELS